jgi:hypothetical protein
MKLEKTPLVVLVSLLRYGRVTDRQIHGMIEGGDRAVSAAKTKLLELPGIYSVSGDLATYNYLSTNRIFTFRDGNNKAISLRDVKHRAVPTVHVPTDLAAMQEFFA